MNSKKRNNILKSMGLKRKYNSINIRSDDDDDDDYDDNDNNDTDDEDNKNKKNGLKKRKTNDDKKNVDDGDNDDDDDEDNDEDDDNDDDDEDNNDNDDDEDDNSIFAGISKKKKKKKTKSKNKIVKDLILPGGEVKSIKPYEAKCIGSGIGEAPRKVVQQIRDYMDILLNSALIEANILTSTETQQPNSMLAIPGIVSAILEYNNISFQKIRYCLTKTDLFEPVWYTYSITKNELILYLNEAMYEEFCSKNSREPVIFTSGIIPIEIFNPYESDPTMYTEIQAPIIHCAIASDHVAQHIINDLYCTNNVACLDIHENFNQIGTTLHSIFYLECACTRIPKREFTNFITLGGPSTSSANTNNTTLMPLMKSTQRLIDSILPPESQSSISDTFAV